MDPEENISSIPWPPNSTFKSVSNYSQVPVLDVVNLNEYFASVCNAKEGHTRYQILYRKGYSMMDQNLLGACIEAWDRNTVFYHGQVNSEYTKQLTYFTKVVIHMDGHILESTCECVAGKGFRAICKHIAVMCYCVLRYSERGMWPLRQTCTENAQKWHMPKKKQIEVSRQKAEQLTFHIPVYNAQKRNKRNLCYDPRPSEFKNSPFQESVRNMTINYCLSYKRRPLGLSGVFKPALISGLINDHDYLHYRLDHQMIWNILQVGEK